MYIKRVIIHGFKSYGDEIAVEALHRQFNVLVGCKSSGKTNFLQAIQFVLSDEFSDLRPMQRLALLHGGTGGLSTSAYVEIVFDNSDYNIKIWLDEVIVRRVIGLNTDQFFLNNKEVPRCDVVKLLQTGGLSISKPYCIVNQHKINVITTATPFHILKLLRETIKTRIHDERTEQLVNKFNGCLVQIGKINQTLQPIEERLKTLEDKKEELFGYENWDRARYVLEFIIHDTGHQENRRELEEEEVFVTRMIAFKRLEAAGLEILCYGKIRESFDKIPALGTLPTARELQSKYQKLTLKQLFEELEKVNQHLQNYNDVNYIDIDDFISLSKQKVILNKRKEGLNTIGEKFRKSIEHINRCKLRAVKFNFKRIFKNFKAVFKELVPQGWGYLIMQVPAEYGPESHQANADESRGVGIRVSFTGREDDEREMDQLSNEQKSLVALALICAVQKCNPSPIYLFDEFDQALDAEHSEAMAKMIHEYSAFAQFITTTSRVELLGHAQKIYGVDFLNEVSLVERATQEEAMDYLI